MLATDLLKQRLEPEEVGYFLPEELGLDYDQAVPIVRTMEYGHIRFYCLIPVESGGFGDPGKTFIVKCVYQVVNRKGGNITFRLITGPKQSRVVRKYFENHLMEELL